MVSITTTAWLRFELTENKIIVFVVLVGTNKDT